MNKILFILILLGSTSSFASSCLDKVTSSVVGIESINNGGQDVTLMDVFDRNNQDLKFQSDAELDLSEENRLKVAVFSTGSRGVIFYEVKVLKSSCIISSVKNLTDY